MSRNLVALSLVGLTSLAACVPGTSCTLIGCGSMAEVDVARVSDRAALANVTIELCIDERCVSGALPLPTQSTPPGAGNRLDLQGAFYASVTVWVESASELRVVAEFVDATGLETGNVYRATIVRSDGTKLASPAWEATHYERTYPNGRHCDDGCVRAELSPLM